jgi:hypothetical protein
MGVILQLEYNNPQAPRALLPRESTKIGKCKILNHANERMSEHLRKSTYQDCTEVKGFES